MPRGKDYGLEIFKAITVPWTLILIFLFLPYLRHLFYRDSDTVHGYGRGPREVVECVSCAHAVRLPKSCEVVKVSA